MADGFTWTLDSSGLQALIDRYGAAAAVTREPFPDLPGWIERGTKRGDPHSHTEPARPYFYASEQLEIGNHVRRIEQALQDAADEATR